jgi:UDP-N-acetylglucosamine 2-epimerase (non-hydrolysing)
MIDTLLANLDRIDAVAATSPLLPAGPYAVATMHRPGNVDDPAQAARVVAMLRGLAELATVVLPLHPRGRPALVAAGLQSSDRLRVIEPLGYLEFLALVRRAALVVTDSGGIQEETTILGVPCLTVRPNTERPITITHGTNRLVEPDAVVSATRALLAGGWEPPDARPPLWDGHAGERSALVVERWLAERAGR